MLGVNIDTDPIRFDRNLLRLIIIPKRSCPRRKGLFASTKGARIPGLGVSQFDVVVVDEHGEIKEAGLGVETQVEADGSRARVVGHALVKLKVAEGPRGRDDGGDGAAVCGRDRIFDGVRCKGSFRKHLTLDRNAVGLAVRGGGRPGAATERERGASCACDAHSVATLAISTLFSQRVGSVNKLTALRNPHRRSTTSR